MARWRDGESSRPGHLDQVISTESRNKTNNTKSTQNTRQVHDPSVSRHPFKTRSPSIPINYPSIVHTNHNNVTPPRVSVVPSSLRPLHLRLPTVKPTTHTSATDKSHTLTIIHNNSAPETVDKHAPHFPLPLSHSVHMSGNPNSPGTHRPLTHGGHAIRIEQVRTVAAYQFVMATKAHCATCPNLTFLASRPRNTPCLRCSMQSHLHSGRVGPEIVCYCHCRYAPASWNSFVIHALLSEWCVAAKPVSGGCRCSGSCEKQVPAEMRGGSKDSPGLTLSNKWATLATYSKPSVSMCPFSRSSPGLSRAILKGE
jgi:hypothetical protein